MSSAAPSSNRRLLVLYTIAVCLYWAAQYVFVPTLSVYVESKAANLASVGVVLSMYGLWQAIVRLPLGIAADWVGRRKPFIIAGFAFAGLGAVVMGMANGMPGLTLGRAFTGVAAGSWVLLVVAFSALFPPEDAVRASSILSAINALARMVATSVTGSLNALGGYTLSFYVAAVLAVLAIIAMLLVRERRHQNTPPTLRQIGTLIVRRDVLVPHYWRRGTICHLGSIFSFATNLAKNLGASDVILSVLVSMNIGLVFLGNLAMSLVARRVSSRWMVTLSFVFVVLGLGALAIAKGLPMVFVGQILMGLASGVGYPVMMGLSIRYVDDGQRATAMGLFQAVYAIGMFAGPWLSGILADAMGIQPMFAITAVVCLVLGLGGTGLLAAKD